MWPRPLEGGREGDRKHGCPTPYAQMPGAQGRAKASKPTSHHFPLKDSLGSGVEDVKGGVQVVEEGPQDPALETKLLTWRKSLPWGLLSSDQASLWVKFTNIFVV